MADNDTRRPNLYLVQGYAGGDPPQRNVARKTAAPGRRGASKAAPSVARGVWGTRWKVQKDLRELPGLAFIRWYLSRFDFSQLEWITVRRSPRSSTCWLPWGTPTGLFRISCNIPASVRYPARVPEAEKPSSGERQPYYLNDESEAVVAIIAFQVGLYLGHTGQIVGVEAIDFMQAAVEAYRRNIGDATSGDDRLPGTHAPHGRARWCVECGRRLSTGGGSRAFCSDRCRWTYHNRLRRARIAARRPERACEVCGTKFTPKRRRDAKTCSPACRQKKYRTLRKDRSNPGL